MVPPRFLLDPLGHAFPAGGEQTGGNHRDYSRSLTKLSTTEGSAKVVVSPNSPMAPAAIFRRILRMILPLRVLGRLGELELVGRRNGADHLAHVLDELLLEIIRVGSMPSFIVTKT